MDADAAWGKAKEDYYYTDYIDKDYPSRLTAKEERLAAIEEEEALRIQKKILSSLDNILDVEYVFDPEQDDDSHQDEQQQDGNEFEYEDEDEDEDEDEIEIEIENEDDGKGEEGVEDDEKDEKPGRQRRPINMAMKKNRGLTPYKKKEYRNPRVKHKLKYKKAMSKRRRNVKEAKIEHLRYSGESSGIKTSTVKSIKLC